MEDIAMEEENVSSDEDDYLDPFESDPPPFKTKHELDKFMKSCDIKPADNSDSDDVDFTITASKLCTCKKCAAILSSDYEHLCCHQYPKWKKFSSAEEATCCITETAAFQQATNHFAVRNLLLQISRLKRTNIADPPPNNSMRFAYYKAAYLFIDGTSKKRRPLPSCVMSFCRQLYPSNDGIYRGFKPQATAKHSN
jgi:hypothetical protein